MTFLYARGYFVGKVLFSLNYESGVLFTGDTLIVSTILGSVKHNLAGCTNTFRPESFTSGSPLLKRLFFHYGYKLIFECYSHFLFTIR